MESLMIAKFMQGILFQDLIYVELEIKTFGLVLDIILPPSTSVMQCIAMGSQTLNNNLIFMTRDFLSQNMSYLVRPNPTHFLEFNLILDQF